jgi:tetratricopeptide (TPR) repeat protein
MALHREKLVRNAEKFVSRGRIEAAIREYRKLLEDQPKDTGTLNRVGDLYARLNRIDEAVRLFAQIAEQYTEEGFFVKAIAIYKKIIKLDPTRLSVYEKLANLYHRQGLVNEARTQYQVLADYYVKHDNAASAISIYQQMADLEPDDPAHRAKLAELYQQEQLNDKALKQYLLIADLMLKHERVEQAVQVLQRGIELSPEDLDFLASALDKLRGAGETEGARRFLEQAKLKNPAAGSLLAGFGSAEDEISAAATLNLEAASGTAREGAESTASWVEEESFEAEVELEIPVPAEDEEISDGSALERALAEAEAAVGDEGASGGSLQDEDLLLEWDEEESESLITPPPDMLEKGPGVAGSGFRDDASALAADESREPDIYDQPAGGGSWEIDLGALDLEATGATVPSAEAPGKPVSPAEDEAEENSIEIDLGEFFLPEDLPSSEAVLGVDTDPDTATDGPYEASSEDGGSAVAEPVLPLEFDLEPGAATSEAESETAEAGRIAAQQTSFDDMLSEAEVLAKYGLKSKAYERVRQVLEAEEHHLGAHRVLIQLHLEDGEEEEVRILAGQLQRLSAEQGEFSEWQKVEDRFAAAGFSLEKAVKKTPSPTPAQRRANRPTGDRIDRLLAELLEDSPIRAAPPSKPPSTNQLLEQILGSRPKKAAPAPPEDSQPPPAAVPSAPAAPPGSTPPPLDLDDDSDIESALASMTPISPAAGGPGPESLSLPEDNFLEDTGTSWLDEVEAQRASNAEANELFQGEDSFFDLAAELEQELTVSDALGPQPAVEQSLEEIVEGFKKGVEEHLGEEDYETHFDLGIAYREMGLLDEAIGEFQIASKAPEHLVNACSMLGICFLDKGLPELAIKWYTRGLSSPDLSEADSLALLFDLGSAYQTLGDGENALKTFVEVYGINSTYRNVGDRIAELQ